MLQGVSCGLLLRVSADGKSARINASWPRLLAARDNLERKVLKVVARNKPFIEKLSSEDGSPSSLRLYQHITTGTDVWVIVLEMSDRSRAERMTVLSLLRWNSEWLKFAIESTPQSSGHDLMGMFAMAIACLDQKEFRGTAMALVTELAAHFACQRVSLGLRKHQSIEVKVVSHTARFKHETRLIQAICAAMDEAVDQDRIITHPPVDARSSAICTAHVQLARQIANGTVCTLPLGVHGQIIGALTLERDSGQAFDRADILQMEQVIAVVAPALWLQHKDEQNLPVKAWHSLKETVARLFGPAHIKMKLAALGVTVLLVFFSFAQSEWRVTADAVVEGRVQRTIAAPIDGYIASVEARAGDVVTAGHLISSLDDSDLRLQRLKWSTLRQQIISESREARAQNDRAQVSIMNAKIAQADAELELIDEQLARIQLLAPFDGIIIEGDLSQLLGTPVSRGDILFKVAPLEDYRIVLEVDEQDIAPIKAGQTGQLILSSMPSHILDLRVEKVTPVSTPRDGRNFFRVEASLLDEDLPLQPGMDGIGKIAVGEANLFWIWTHDLGNWLRLKVWTWWR